MKHIWTIFLLKINKNLKKNKIIFELNNIYKNHSKNILCISVFESFYSTKFKILDIQFWNFNITFIQTVMKKFQKLSIKIFLFEVLKNFKENCFSV